MKPEDKKKLKIVDYGKGPHLYAGEAVGLMFDGHAVTLTFGNLESRFPKKDAPPTEPPVIAVCGKITLTPTAAAEVANMLANLLNTLSGNQPKGPHGPVMN